jgi:exopolysaccharide biosynthesis protein
VAPGVFQILAGGQIIEEDGKAIEYTSAFATNRHPRTVVGLDRTGTKLTLVTVDGRQSNLSIGMTLHELSQQMILLGCTSALNLDGGGSTTLVYRDPATHAQKVVNSPSDSRERSVADALGIMVQAPMPPPD